MLRLVVGVNSGALPPPMFKISSKYAITNLRNFYKFTFNQFSFLNFTTTNLCRLIQVSLGVYRVLYTFFWPAEFPGYHQWQQESQ